MTLSILARDPEPLPEQRAVIACPHCASSIPLVDLDGERAQRCPACNMSVFALIAPRALSTPARGENAELVMGSEATCFFHSDKAASVACQRCGRFVCRLCEVDIDGQQLCPECFNRASQKGTIESLRQREVLYDSMALTIGWAWLLIWPSFIVALPVVIYLSVRHWKSPSRSLLPRRPWRFVVGLIGAAGLPLTLFLLIYGSRR